MIGCDIVRIERVAHLYKRHGSKFLAKFMDEGAIGEVSRAESIAGMWAAKEAAYKALCLSGERPSFQGLKIGREAMLDGAGARNVAVLLQGKEKHKAKWMAISVSHDGEYAMAVALINKRI